MFEITSKGFGSTAVVDSEGKLLGIFTDGDLRRFIAKHRNNPLEKPVTDGMTVKPKVIKASDHITKALNVMECYEISVLIVIDEESRPVGILHIHDIIKAGVA